MILLIIMIVVALIIVGLGIAFYLFYKDRKLPPTDYYTLFVIGICWTPLGAVGFAVANPGLYGLSVMGIVFLVIGIIHKKEWKKNHKSWDLLDPKERQFKMWIIMILLGLLVLGALAFFAVRMWYP